MARIRSVKPSFFSSLDTAALPIPTRLTFIGLWCYADDKGRGLDDARLIKAEVWPLDRSYTERKIARDLDTLARQGQVERYEAGGRQYFRIRSWGKHQHPNRPQPSKLPSSPEEGNGTARSLNDHGTRTNDSPPEGRGGGGEQEKEGRGSVDTLSAVTNPGREPVGADNGFTKGDEPLVLRLVHLCSGPKVQTLPESMAVIERCRNFVDDRLIDESIGYCEGLTTRPAWPRYVLSRVAEQAEKHGIAVGDDFTVWESARASA